MFCNTTLSSGKTSFSLLYDFFVLSLISQAAFIDNNKVSIERFMIVSLTGNLILKILKVYL